MIEASRPRALEQLGIDATAIVAGGGPRVWVSITGHGRDGAGADWVAFGDDAAVAGGLVAHDEHGPVFCADAIADPIAGVVAAGAALQALAAGGRWLLDVSLSAVAAAAGRTDAAGHRPVEVAAPHARAAAASRSPPRRAQRRARADRYRGIGKMTGSSAIAATAASRSSADGAW